MRDPAKILRIVLIGLMGTYVLLQLIPRLGPGPKECVFEDRIQPAALSYTDHALCRMACRDISQKLIEKVYREGELNCGESSFNSDQPRFALELRDGRGDKIRLIIETESEEHTVITAYRLGRQDLCECT